MGIDVGTKSTAPEKSASPAPVAQNGMQVYPPTDWAAMQAFYGPGIPRPHYYNSTYPSGHPPHHPYMWGLPQAMMPSFAAPYAAIFSQGGVYAHPGLPMVSPKPGLAALLKPSATETLAATVLTIQTPGNKPEYTTGRNAASESGDTGGPSEPSEGKTDEGEQYNSKRKREGSPDLEKTVKLEIQANSLAPMVNLLGPDVNVKLENVAELDMKSNHTVASKMSCDAQHRGLKLSSETCLQRERQLKQERRKQSNRESARRSRLRKQAESEVLASKVDVLMAENMTLKSEITQLVKNSEKLKLENLQMMDKLKITKLDKIGSDNLKEKRALPPSTENLLSRVNNSGSIATQEQEGEMYRKNNTNVTKLRQLLGASPRADVVAAS